MTIPSISNGPDGQNAMSYIPHVGWLSHQPNEELITLLHRGCFEAAEQAFFWLFLRPGDCFVDCGAHIGLYSVIAHNATRGKLELISIDADPKTFLYLKENIGRIGQESCTLLNAAVWDSPGNIGFVDAGHGRAAYSHVSFDDTGALRGKVRTVTLDEVISAVSVPEITLMKIDVEGAEPEALSGGAHAIAERRCPLIMIEFTEANLSRRGVTSVQLARQLEKLGYELCEFSPSALELLKFPVEGPVWYKNLFACIDRAAINSRLASAPSENKLIARDILERADACSLYAELEELEHYKSLANLAVDAKKWAERAEFLLEQERQTNAQMRNWAESAEARIAEEQDTVRKTRDWAERAELLLEQERQTNAQIRKWAESAEVRVSEEQDTLRKTRDWAERTEILLSQERERAALLEMRVFSLQALAHRVKWLYKILLWLRRGN